MISSPYSGKSNGKEHGKQNGHWVQGLGLLSRNCYYNEGTGVYGHKYGLGFRVTTLTAWVAVKELNNISCVVWRFNRDNGELESKLLFRV